MAITEVFVQVTDVPLGLWGSSLGWPQVPKSHQQALGVGGVSTPESKRQEALREAPTSARQCYRTDEERPGSPGEGRRGGDRRKQRKTENDRLEMRGEVSGW